MEEMRWTDATRNLFFSHQNFIKETLKRIGTLLFYYTHSEERDNLLTELKIIIDSMDKGFPDNLSKELKILFTENYIIFSYWRLTESGKIMLDTPSIVIINKDMKGFYFIDQVLMTIKELEEGNCIDLDEYDSDFIATCIRHNTILKNRTITEYSTFLKNYTGDIFYDCFQETESFIKKLSQ